MQDVQALELGFSLPKPAGKVARFFEFTRRFQGLLEKHGPLYPATMVAKALGVSRQRIYELVEQGYLVQVKVDHHAFISEASVKEWIAQERRGGRPFHRLTLGESLRAASDVVREMRLEEKAK